MKKLVCACEASGSLDTPTLGLKAHVLCDFRLQQRVDRPWGEVHQVQPVRLRCSSPSISVESQGKLRAQQWKASCLQPGRSSVICLVSACKRQTVRLSQAPHDHAFKSSPRPPCTRTALWRERWTSECGTGALRAARGTD